MRYFKLKCGSHRDVEKVDYIAGDVVSSETDLVKSFGDQRFEEVDEKALKKSKKKRKKRDAAEELVEKYGDEVTADFPNAGADYRIFKKGTKYNIHESDDMDAPLDSYGNKKQVTDWLKS